MRRIDRKLVRLNMQGAVHSPLDSQGKGNADEQEQSTANLVDLPGETTTDVQGQRATREVRLVAFSNHTSRQDNRSAKIPVDTEADHYLKRRFLT